MLRCKGLTSRVETLLDLGFRGLGIGKDFKRPGCKKGLGIVQFSKLGPLFAIGPPDQLDADLYGRRRGWAPPLSNPSQAFAFTSPRSYTLKK